MWEIGGLVLYFVSVYVSICSSLFLGNDSVSGPIHTHFLTGMVVLFPTSLFVVTSDYVRSKNTCTYI